MKEMTIYVTRDGKKFDEKEKALAYEETLMNDEEKKVVNCIKTIQDYCYNTRLCAECIFQNFCNMNWKPVPADWDLDEI